MGEAGLVVSDVDDGLRERLDAQINAFDVAATGYADPRPLGIAARDHGGDLCAGVSGWTWGGCAYIEFLWVRQDHRGSGLGSRLLAAAGHEARRRGCDQVALSTRSFQAPGFHAVVSAFKLHFGGFLGWRVWLFIHIGLLTGYRNRIGAILSCGSPSPVTCAASGPSPSTTCRSRPAARTAGRPTPPTGP